MKKIKETTTAGATIVQAAVIDERHRLEEHLEIREKDQKIELFPWPLQKS